MSSAERAIAAIALFTLGLLLGYRIRFITRAGNYNFQPVRVHNANFNFIGPLIGCNFNESKDFAEYLPLKNKISDYIKQEKAQYAIDDVGVYFRELEKGRWFGINENDKFDPASLFKVPIMISFYKEAETDPNILNQEIDYLGNESDGRSSNGIIDSQFLSVGKSYTISDLIDSMIKNSDNDAKNLLLNNIDAGYLNEIFRDLGMLPPDSQQSVGISAKMYSLFFRILYNSTYLNMEMSNRALDLMTRTSFGDGLTKFLPSGTVVSHKYGERGIFNGDKLVGAELHDCGIIYGKGNPYLLCVMTRGARLTDLEDVIQRISLLVYQGH